VEELAFVPFLAGAAVRANEDAERRVPERPDLPHRSSSVPEGLTHRPPLSCLAPHTVETMLDGPAAEGQ
jgi:hypothetical protein